MFKSIRRIAIFKGRVRISKRRIKDQKVLKKFLLVLFLIFLYVVSKKKVVLSWTD